jgi:hypothetical protein
LSSTTRPGRRADECGGGCYPRLCRCRDKGGCRESGSSCARRHATRRRRRSDQHPEYVGIQRPCLTRLGVGAVDQGAVRHKRLRPRDRVFVAWGRSTASFWNGPSSHSPCRPDRDTTPLPGCPRRTPGRPRWWREKCCCC